MHYTSPPYIAMPCCATMCPAVGGKPTGIRTLRIHHPLCFPIRCHTLRCSAVRFFPLPCAALDGKTHREEDSKILNPLCFHCHAVPSLSLLIDTQQQLVENPPGSSLFLSYHPLCFPVRYGILRCNTFPNISIRCLAVQCSAFGGKPTGREPVKSPDPLCFPSLCPALLRATFRCYPTRCGALLQTLLNPSLVQVTPRSQPVRGRSDALKFFLG
jgi:hypothetical protein